MLNIEEGFNTSFVFRKVAKSLINFIVYHLR